MLAGNMKLKHFLFLVGGFAGVVTIAGFVLMGGVGAKVVDDAAERSERRLAAASDEAPRSRTPEGSKVPKAPASTTSTEPKAAASSPAASASSESASTPAPTGRPVDRFILGKVGRDLGTKKVKDATKGKPYKVNLYQDEGNSSVSRAKVDLDRDDQWDEKWTIDGDSVTRKVASADDEQYDVAERWDGSVWVAR